MDDSKLVENFYVDLEEKILPGFTLTITNNNQDFMIFDTESRKYVVAFTLLGDYPRVYFRFQDMWVQAITNYNNPLTKCLEDILKICDIIFSNYREWSSLVDYVESGKEFPPNEYLFLEAIFRKLYNLGFGFVGWTRYCTSYGCDLPYGLDKLISFGSKLQFIEYDRAGFVFD